MIKLELITLISLDVEEISLSPGEIQYAFENLTDPNYLESRSVDARQELDLRIGCAFTRLQTAHMAKTMNTKEKIVVSFGPCQTPTLGFCVARDDFIKKFQSQTYWGIDVRVSLDNQATGNSYYSNFNRDQDTLKLYWDRGRIFDKEAINAFCLLVRGDINQGPPRALVKSMTANIKQCYPPLPLNTVQLLRIASSAFGHSPHHTMDLAEKLYTSGYISYPRTETSAYSAGFDFQSILNAARSVPHLSPAVNKIMAQGGPNQQNRFGGKDVGDHPPITPTPQILYSNSFDRDDGKKQIYDYIFTHFLATLMGNAKYLEYVTTFEINGEIFKSEHRELLEAGFMEIMPWKLGENGLTNKSVNHQRTEFKEGMIYPVIKVETTEYQTKPPNLLTESELIKLMETHGIGTDASIPVHIKKIIDRNYVKIVGNTANRKNFKSSFQNNDFDNDQEGNTNSGGGKARYLMPTQLGIALVHGYEMIDAELVLPTMRAAMEKQLNLIANGGALYDNVVSHTLNNYVSKYRFFESNLGLISTRNIGSLTSNSPSNENGRGRSNSGNRSGFGRSSSTGFRSRNSSGGSFKGGRGGRGGGRGKVRGRRGGGKQSGAKEVTITARYNIAPPPVVTGSNGYVSAPIYNTERLKRFLE
ncbi:DNA topoisomerase 3-beta-1-like isoform X2 [Gordionus sp. m RMFG-2023]|uniref:DNA topoisomerase 3-beta-1-like isoform X2 n=1 Tax=Gordionus sp. m RMFG-2023 TaxID=3053472 RepID=UPI0031FCC610